jgi:hypothetical protein
VQQQAPVIRRPSESYECIILPFSENTRLRDEYLNPYGYLRFGKILEDMV